MNENSNGIKGDNVTAPLPPRQSGAGGDLPTNNRAPGQPATPSFDGTMVKPLTELEKARFDAALIEPLEKRHENLGTGALNKPEVPAIDLLLMTIGQRGTSVVTAYSRIPAAKKIANSTFGRFMWRIELCGLGPGIQPVGFDILDDVVIGRGRQADIDLGMFGASNRGVSRRHAMLRPTALHLHLIDLGSTNGTYFNSVRLAYSATRPIGHDDVITLGALSFAIKIVDSPPDAARRLKDRP